MKPRLYPLKHYTEQGDLKPPIAFTFILFFLARTWILLVISVVSGESGTKILQLFYPDKMHFYLGLLGGILPLLILFISGRRHAQKKWAMIVWPYGLYIIYLGVLSDFIMQLFYLNIVHFKYSLTASIQIVLILWSMLFVFKSKQLKDAFRQ